MRLHKLRSRVKTVDFVYNGSGQFILLTSGDVLVTYDTAHLKKNQPFQFAIPPNFTVVGKSGCVEAYCMCPYGAYWCWPQFKL